MADVTVKYKGNTIAEMSEEGIKTLKTSGKYCEDDISVSYVPPAIIETNDVFGMLDQSNSVLLEGNLADGTYIFKYKKNDGTYVDIGTLVLDNKVYYSVSNNLTNCVNNNEATTVIGGTSYSATITMNSDYIISSIVVTMGGTNVTSSVVDGNTITIPNITGNIVITAIAVIPSYTNLAEPNDTNTTWNGDWVNNARMGSDGSYRSSEVSMVTNTIAVNKGDVLYFSGTGFTAKGNGVTNGYQIGVFKDKEATIRWYGGTPEDLAKTYDITFTYYEDGTLKSMAYNVNDAATTYYRLCLSKDVDKSKVIISKEPIT